MKTKHRGLLAIAAVAALSLTACAGGADEPAAAAPAASGPSSAPQVLAAAESSDTDIENYLVGSWSCETTGDNEDPSIFGLPSSAKDLPSEITFQSDEQWVGPENVLWGWSHIDDTMLIEIEEHHIFLDLPSAIQIPSTVTVTSHVKSDYGEGSSLEATNDIAFEIDKMTMKTAAFTDPNAEPQSDSGETVTCSK